MASSVDIRRSMRWFLVGLLIFAGPTAAQDVRYVGRAVGQINPDGTTEEEVRAGGVSADNPCGTSASKTCSIEDPDCFNVVCGESSTEGGAHDDADPPAARPGFPRVVSSSAGRVFEIAPLIEVTGSDTRAIADAFTGELVSECDCSQVLVLGVPGPDCPDGGTAFPIPIPILNFDAVVLPCRKSVTSQNGFAQVTIAGAVVRASNGEETILSQSTAGVEIPFTSGGAAAGCNLSGSNRSLDSGLPFGLLAILGWFFAVRRRQARATRKPARGK